MRKRKLSTQEQKLRELIRHELRGFTENFRNSDVMKNLRFVLGLCQNCMYAETHATACPCKCHLIQRRVLLNNGSQRNPDLEQFNQLVTRLEKQESLIADTLKSIIIEIVERTNNH